MHEREIIQVKDLGFSYNGKSILKRINLSVFERDFVSIVGPNGGGKTTLVKVLLGLLKPDYGVVRIFGEVAKEARTRIGYMPQYLNYDHLFPVKVMDVVLMGRLGRGSIFIHKTDRSKALDSLDKVGLRDLHKEPFANLSGGQKQRVLIARALVSSPELLILDEPTSSLDQESEKNFYSLLKKLNEKLTIIIVSHDIAFVSEYVNRIFCVNRNLVEHPVGIHAEEEICSLYGHHMNIVCHDKNKCGEEK